METEALIGKVITRSYAIEKLLKKHYPTEKTGLFPVIKSLEGTLPAILVRTIRIIAAIRNTAAHPDGFTADSVPEDFDRLCNEIELLIPYFASRQQAKPSPVPKEPKLPASKPKPAVVSEEPNCTEVAKQVAPNHGKPWTPEEDTRLTDAFDAQTSIPDLAKAHQRGVGGIQNRLIKLNRLTADQYKAYPPESL